MLVFAGLTPHSPLLLPSVNTEKIGAVSQTRIAMAELAEELYAAKPETILLFSKHPTMYADAFSINLCDPFKLDLREFGDLSHHQTFHPDFLLIDRVQRALRYQKIPLTLTSDEALHYAAAVPLLLLTEHLSDVHLFPMSYAKDLSLKDHYALGATLKDLILDSDHRIAVIASGDLSHALTSTSPSGFAPEGDMFDKKIQELIVTKNSAGLLQMESSLFEKAEEEISKPLALLLGIIERMSGHPRILSYEAPFGVGYLVVNFQIN
ncbi:MAG: class III extradiol dioxygenase subunit B-like domain-containing protein [Patescibacteria group bacterium]|jgi:aromatic ring-opening dioxygenase LigB subunit